MRVQVIRKFADVIDGIDLSAVHVGDIIDLNAREAALLVVEGWARELPPAARQLPAGARKDMQARTGPSGV
jgi:hypothetical protein